MTFRQLTIKYFAAAAAIFWCVVPIAVVLQAFQNPLYLVALVVILPCAAFIISASLIKLFGIKKFDSEQHNRIISTEYNEPTVDVFLPICGENIGTIKKTWKAVSRLDYPHERLNVYVLDDKTDPTMRELAAELRFDYIARGNNEYKKAGNINNAYKQTTGEYIVIFDYDFQPVPNFLRETIPHMLADDSVGIVQTPQAFDYEEKNGLEQGAGNIQDFFYSIVQPARDTFNAAICVGTNAVYRRRALDTIGGNVLIEHSEDVWTGFTLTSAGYTVKYLPINLAYGECPADSYSYFKQQTRWAQGSSSLTTSPVFWRSKITAMQRLAYISGFLFYVYSALILLFPLLSILGGDTTHNPALIGYVALSLIVTTFLIYRNSNLNTVVAHCLATWSYTYALVNKFVLRRNEAWQPTGAKKSGTSLQYRATMACMLVYTVLITLYTIYSVFSAAIHVFTVYLIINSFVHIVTSVYLMREKIQTI